MKKLIILGLIICSIGCNNVQAEYIAYDAGTINSDLTKDLVIHELMTRTRGQQKVMEKEAIRKQQEQQGQQKQNEVEQVAISDIKQISFVNNHSIPTEKLQMVVKDYINKPMNSENIAGIIKTIMNYYQSNGYYSVVAMVVSQDVNSGSLVLNIKEGGKNSIVVE